MLYHKLHTQKKKNRKQKTEQKKMKRIHIV